MVGVKVNQAIAIRRPPNFIHAKWNISHSDQFFDSAPRNGISVPGTLHNGCGKADILQEMWTNNLDFQLESDYSQRYTVIRCGL